MAAALCFMATSCSSSKSQSGSGSGKYVTTQGSALSKVAQFTDWSTLETSGSVTISAGKSFSSSMRLKMERGKSISISLRPLLGIEVARIHIEGEDIVIIDRIHKLYVKEKVSLLTSGVPVDVSTVQDLLLGRAHILGEGTLSMGMEEDVKITEKDGSIELSPVKTYQGINYTYTFDSLNQIASLDVYPENAASIYNVAYSDVTTTIAGKIATTTNVSTTISNRAVALDLELSNLKWNGTIDNTFEIPSSYSQAEAESVLKALGATTK